MSGKKGMYHSELVKMSPVTALIMSEPTDSKFPDRPKWIALEIDGEERFLSCENVGIELGLAGLKGQWARLNAKGRGEEAIIEVEDVPISPDSRGTLRECAPTAAKAESDSNPALSRSGAGERAFAKPPANAFQKAKAAMMAEAPGDKIRTYAAHSRRVFNIAWEESGNWLATIPERDAAELSVRDWYDLRLRVAQGITIEVNKIIRKERF